MSKDKKKEDKRSFFEYLAVRGDISGDAFAGDVYLELRGKNSIILKGCRRILAYSPEKIVLKIKEGILSLNGKRLVCTAFHSGGVSVEGDISSIVFGAEVDE